MKFVQLVIYLFCDVSVSSVLHHFIACFSLSLCKHLANKFETQNFARDFHRKLDVVARCYKSVHKICANKSEMLTHTYFEREFVKHNHIFDNVQVSVIGKYHVLLIQ